VILPEIFATAAIILSAYACKFEGKRNWRLLIIALSVITMMVGIYYTAVLGLYSVLP
jgi:membrane-bound ClpP family serine protease